MTRRIPRASRRVVKPGDVKKLASSLERRARTTREDGLSDRKRRALTNNAEYGRMALERKARNS